MNLSDLPIVNMVEAASVIGILALYIRYLVGRIKDFDSTVKTLSDTLSDVKKQNDSLKKELEQLQSGKYLQQLTQHYDYMMNYLSIAEKIHNESNRIFKDRSFSENSVAQHSNNIEEYSLIEMGSLKVDSKVSKVGSPVRVLGGKLKSVFYGEAGVNAWQPEMKKYQGVETVVTEISDDDGPPAVRIQADNGDYWWDQAWLKLEA